MHRSLKHFGTVALVAALAGCDLAVQNPNQPETERVLKTPADVEALLGTQYLRWHTAMYGALGNVGGMAGVQSFENFSSLSNNCMGQRVGIPRPSNDNSVGNGCSPEQLRVYSIENEVARTTSNIIGKLNESGFTLGSAAQDARARAFAEFLRGVALGYVALVYDSGTVVTPDLGPEDAGELVGYPEVMAGALEALQNSIDAASASASGANGFPLPTTWLPGPTSMTSAEFVKLVRSYRARLRANVARTPAERAAVNWDAVIADAQAGITADHLNTTNTVSGPFNSWVAQLNTFSTWHQMTPFVVGMGDKSGAYAAWVATPLDDRSADGTPFFMVTDDLRFPQGASRAAQQADFAISSCSAAGTTCKRYFRNRPTGDDIKAGPSWGWSNYDFVSYYTWRTSGAGTGQNGDLPFFKKAELDLLEAEGQYRKGNFAAAAALINKTRTAKGGLPAITAFDATSPVPGGDACVPKVPVGPSYSTIACGNMLEALKWEKRIETIQSHFLAWFLDSRGWGDLPEGTGVHWPVPYQDLQARGRTGSAIYSTGGTGGNSGAAAKGTYGW
ncbi:MAG: hypothetical protein AB7L66_16125 [Gemmatimonadales bacterium]